MKLLKSVFVASSLAFGVFSLGVTAAPAATVSGPQVFLPVPGMTEYSAAEQVRHRRYRRFRHGRRYRRRHRRYRHYHGGYWYAYPWWSVPLYTEPRRYGRCDYWYRRCRSNWGGGPDFRGCLRYHGCL